MRFLNKTKDGGPESPVDIYFLIEMKHLFSIALLKFNKGGREAYHTHAFDALTWFLSGSMFEEIYQQEGRREYTRSLLPKVTRRDKNHRVIARKDSWCFTIRGPWKKTWTEHRNKSKTTFTWGRRKLCETCWEDEGYCGQC